MDENIIEIIHKLVTFIENKEKIIEDLQIDLKCKLHEIESLNHKNEKLENELKKRGG